MVPYLPPAPFFGTGLHRCLFLLFEQSRALDPLEVGQAISWFTFREEFRFSQWAASMGPGFSAPAAVNGFYVEWEQCCDLYHLAARCRPPEQFLSPSQKEAVQRDLALGTYTPQATKSLLDDDDDDDDEDEEEDEDEDDEDEYGEEDEEEEDGEDGEEDGDDEDDVEDENEAARQGDDGDQRRGDSAAAESFQPSPEEEEEEEEEEEGPAEDSAASPEVEAVQSPPQSESESESPRPPDLSVAEPEPEPCAAPSSAPPPSRRSSCAARKKSEFKALRKYLDALERQRQRRDSEQVRGPPAPFNPEKRLKRVSKQMRRMSAVWQPAVQTFLDETT